MSGKEQPARDSRAAIPWLGAAVAGVVGVAAVVSYATSEETQAQAGSPLYDSAVREALRGLTDLGGGGGADAVPGARPPLPAGLSPADHYWCDKCKAYHRRQPDQALPANPAVPPADGAAQAPAVQASGAIPPLPEGFSPADYYWCDKCKAYHKRQAEPGVPATPSVPPAGGGAQAPAVQAPGAIPPLPEGFSPADDSLRGRPSSSRISPAGANPGSHR